MISFSRFKWKFQPVPSPRLSEGLDQRAQRVAMFQAFIRHKFLRTKAHTSVGLHSCHHLSLHFYAGNSNSTIVFREILIEERQPRNSKDSRVGNIVPNKNVTFECRQERKADVNGRARIAKTKINRVRFTARRHFARP